MKTWALCGADWRRATRKSSGVEPLLSPPVGSPVDLLPATHCDLVVFNLHGYDGQDYYYGQGDGVTGPTAVSLDDVTRHRWDGVVVFAEVCFSAKDGGGAIARAFLDQGARAFIGSTTEAYGRIRPTVLDGEADRLCYFFRKLMRKNEHPSITLNRAKALLRVVSIPLDDEDRQTLDSFICLSEERVKSHDKN